MQRLKLENVHITHQSLQLASGKLEDRFNESWTIKVGGPFFMYIIGTIVVVVKGEELQNMVEKTSTTSIEKW